MHYISTEMDELSREEFFRIKRTQQKKIKKREIQAEKEKLKIRFSEFQNGRNTPPEDTPVKRTLDDILDEADKIANGNQEADDGSQSHYDSMQPCDECCHEKLGILKQDTELMEKSSDNPLFQSVKDSKACDNIPCHSEGPKDQKQINVGLDTPIQTSSPKNCITRTPDTKIKDTRVTMLHKNEAPKIKDGISPKTSKKQFDKDEISPLPSITATSKSESPLDGSSLGYVKRTFKETVKIRRLPNRSGKICEEKEIVTVRSEIKKYMPTHKEIIDNKDWCHIDQFSTTSSDTTQAGPSNKKSNCRECLKDAKHKSSIECQNKCWNLNDSKNDTQVNHIVLPCSNPALEGKSGNSSQVIPEDHKLNNTLREFGLTRWHDWTETISPKSQSDTNTCSKSISKAEEKENLCYLPNLVDYNDSKYDKNSVLPDPVDASVKSAVKLSNKDSNEKQHQTRNTNEVTNTPATINDTLTRCDLEVDLSENEDLVNVLIEPSYSRSLSEVNTKINVMSSLDNENNNKDQSQTCNDNEVKNTVIKESESLTKCNLVVDASDNENQLNVPIQPKYLKSFSEVKNIDDSRSLEKRVNLIISKNKIDNNHSALSMAFSISSCIACTAAQAEHLENIKIKSAACHTISSEFLSPQDKLNLIGDNSISESPKVCSQNFGCGQNPNFEETEILSLVCPASTYEDATKSLDYCNIELNNVEQQISPNPSILHENSISNCRSVLNTLKGYLSKIWQQMKNINTKDCIYYQAYDTKDDRENLQEEIEGIIRYDKIATKKESKAICTMCENNVDENGNGTIQKLFENIQNTLKKSFVTKNTYSQTSQSNFEFSRDSSILSQFLSNNGSTGSPNLSNSECFEKCIFDDTRNQLKNDYESQRCHISSTAPCCCSLFVAESENNLSLSSNTKSINSFNNAERENQYDSQMLCPDCIREQTFRYAIDYNGESTKPRRHSKTKCNVYHQYMVLTDNVVPKCFSSKCVAMKCNPSTCSAMIDVVNSQLIDIIDMLPSPDMNTCAMSSINKANRTVELYSNRIRGIRRNLYEIERRIADSDKSFLDIEQDARQCFTNSGFGKIQSNAFNNVVDSLTSFMWKQSSQYNNDQEVCEACQKPLILDTSNVTTANACCQTDIFWNMTKCELENNFDIKHNLGLKSPASSSVNASESKSKLISFASDAREKSEQNNKKNIKRNCKLCRQAFIKEFNLHNGIYNPSKNSNMIEALIDRSLELNSKVPIIIMLEIARDMEPAIQKAITNVIKCGNRQCIKKLASLFCSTNACLLGNGNKNV